MLKIPKPSSVLEMPKTEIMPLKLAKPLRSEIKTVVADTAADFDRNVNVQLRNGWKVRETKILAVGNMTVQILYFAILERLVEVDESESN